ncbi:MAG: Bifunctional homocysteine S-methyltransferase/5,10-methylenetetrahydrofolate reductase [Candidatus Hydrogenedentes bacterium ADurb.Bin101]|jgi:5-methyltetrahydrofolate--homocysteine methyltransferase|nr:homocysteine S-methyltransferase family protein [Candidatus Hydrogenedentota bacterium]OQC08096.1 MAG: Bifunctional homocysteine S-methyltransferase/5,10-methylenetetrahydrofolate reductase [Candidatus Hydrogenedentes bacterium ADurb.Bin101]HOC67900.1 homocysteine S-methyltransferase family protein [Candidatus Hydrogenedentota bacterium]
MPNLLTAVKTKGILVSDGGWGSFLVARGLRPGESPERWNLDHPDEVRGIARMYAEAGADVVLTNTFGGTRFKLEHFGLADRVGEINETAARLSREAVGPDKIVLASMGPTGKILMMGDVSEAELYEAFKEQAVALEKGGADAVTVETMTALDEGGIAVRAAKENTALTIVASFTFDTKTPQGYRTMMGVSPEMMAEAMLDAGADVLGANCSLGSGDMVEVIAALHAAAPGIPLIVHPNAGKPEQQPDGSIVYPETPACMAGNVPALIDAGASIIGGCCGTGPDHIRAIRAAVDTTLAG